MVVWVVPKVVEVVWIAKCPKKKSLTLFKTMRGFSVFNRLESGILTST